MLAGAAELNLNLKRQAEGLSLRLAFDNPGGQTPPGLAMSLFYPLALGAGLRRQGVRLLFEVQWDV